MYTLDMEVTWDTRKAKANFLKHRVYFADAESVLYDSLAISIPDHDTENEERFVATGCDSLGRILTIVYAYRDDTIRLISARKATKKERYYYESTI